MVQDTQQEPLAGANPDAFMQPFVQFWTTAMEQANVNALKFYESFDPSTNLQDWRKRWFEATSESLDAYMRSPAFLEAMRHNLDATIKTKLQANDLSKEAARNAGVPTVSDISGLFERIHSVESTVLSKLGAIENRLQAIETKLNGQAPQTE